VPSFSHDGADEESQSWLIKFVLLSCIHGCEDLVAIGAGLPIGREQNFVNKNGLLMHRLLPSPQATVHPVPSDAAKWSRVYI
jgi:hypothetical protein